MKAQQASVLLDLYDSLVPSISSSQWSVAQIIATTLVAGFVAFLARRRYFSPISHVPGPFLASMSRLWHMNQILRGKHNLTLMKLHNKLGHFVRVSPDEVSVSHPGAIKALYLTPITKGDWYSIFTFPDSRYPLPISIQDPKKKAEFMKYHSNAGLSLRTILNCESTIDEQVAKLLGWMDHYSHTGKPMKLDEFLTFIAFDIVGELTFSKPFGFIEKGEDISHAIAQNEALQFYLCTFGYYRWASFLVNNPLVNWLQIQPANYIVRTTFNGIRERSKNPDIRFDMYSHWYRGLEKAKHDQFHGYSEHHLYGAAVAIIAAGSSTVSTALQSFIYHLIHAPERWIQIQEEIDAARENGHCQTPVITYEDATKLPRLEAAIKESLRIFPPIPMGLPRVAPPGGITIGDQTFPAGVTLSLSATVLHLSKEIWGPDAEEFNPDRWCSPDIASKERFFVPFGVGWTSCPGQQLAKVELFKILATIVRDYEIQLVNPDQEWKWSAYFGVVPCGWPVHLVKREQ